jgi:hypothetical protein
MMGHERPGSLGRLLGLSAYVRADGLIGIYANYNDRPADRFPLVEEIVSLEWQRGRAECPFGQKKASGAEAAGEDEG